MIRVAQVATVAGSVRHLLLDHLARLQEVGYEVEAICAEDDHLGEIQGKGFPVQVVPFEREPHPIKDARTLEHLRALFVRRRYDVVHSHTPKAGLLSPLAARLARVPRIFHTIHGLLFHDRMRPLRKVAGAVAEYWTARLAHRVFSQSREDVEVAVRMHLRDRDRIHYLGNGIDLRVFSPNIRLEARARQRAALGFAEADVVVGIVGRLVREKGFVEFFDALSRVLPARPNVRALVVGPNDAGQADGLHPDQLLDGTDRSRVVWLGRREDMPELYAAMDLFVLPSHREGIPRTLMEASAMGLPVVASDIRGCREVVVRGSTGLLFELGDARALEEAIVALVDDAGRRVSFGEAGTRHIASEFDAEFVLRRLVEYYQRFVGDPRSTGA